MEGIFQRLPFVCYYLYSLFMRLINFEYVSIESVDYEAKYLVQKEFN